MKLIFLIIFLYPVKFKLKEGKANSVLLAGDFTNWEKNPLKMEKRGDIWEVTLDLEPGRYEYKFIVDGNWISDPENPLKVGPYGNSLIEITDKGEVIIPKTISNTGWNTAINFSGDIRFHLNLEDTLKKFKTLSDSKLDLKGYLPYNSLLWVRLRYQNKNLQSDGSIPVFFERAEFILREKNLSLRGFYNKFILSSLEPFDLTGNIGEFHKDFGREEEGFVLSYKSKILNLNFLYSNGWREGRDLIFNRFTFYNFLSINYFKNKGFDRKYSTISPDSLSANGELLLFNSYKEENFISSDIKKNIKNFEFNIASGKGEIFWKADEKSNGENFKHYLKICNFSRFYSSIRYISNFETGIFTEYDVFDLKKFFGNYREGLLFSGLFFKENNFNLILKHYYFIVGSEKPFSNLFYFHRLNQLMYFETFSLGFKELLSLVVEFKTKKLPFFITGKFSSPGFGYYPYSSEIIFKWIQKIFKDYEIFCDVRFINFDAPHLRIKNSFLSPYLELRKIIYERSYVFLSYGLDPFTLEEDEWARRIYLTERGANMELISDSYLRYGRKSLLAERDLENLILLKIGIEIRF
ncbi:MAG: glycogen-binding domain-containing protein [candidate division WOR-3 bacterium]